MAWKTSRFDGDVNTVMMDVADFLSKLSESKAAAAKVVEGTAAGKPVVVVFFE